MPKENLPFQLKSYDPLKLNFHVSRTMFKSVDLTATEHKVLSEYCM